MMQLRKKGNTQLSQSLWWGHGCGWMWPKWMANSTSRGCLMEHSNAHWKLGLNFPLKFRSTWITHSSEYIVQHVWYQSSIHGMDSVLFCKKTQSSKEQPGTPQWICCLLCILVHTIPVLSASAAWSDLHRTKIVVKSRRETAEIKSLPDDTCPDLLTELCAESTKQRAYRYSLYKYIYYLIFVAKGTSNCAKKFHTCPVLGGNMPANSSIL